jgi:ketosteroid isomerase-like protein
MSQGNVEIVRQAFEAYGRRDVDSIVHYLDPEFELHSAIVGGAEGAVYWGPNGVRKWLADSDESFEELRFEATEFRDLGDQVLILGHLRARGRESGLEINSPTGWLSTLRGGKLTKSEGFLSWDEALEAAGLSE